MRWLLRARASRALRSFRGRPRIFDRLEERTLLAGNLVVVDEVPGRININLQQYTQSGSLVSSVPIPQPPGQTEYQAGRGVTVDSLGKIDLIDGTAQPYLSTYTPSTQSWNHQTYAGWGIGGNISYGMVGSLGRYVYASNQGTAGGTIRFDTQGGPTTSFAAGKSFEQLTVGQDGLIYGLGYDSLYNQVAYGYDPSTLALVKSVVLSPKTGSTDYIRSIAVDSTGEIFAAGWDDGKVYKLDPTGKTIEAQVQLMGQNGFGENLMSIALDSDGQIAVGGRFGEIYLTNESLSSVQTIQTGQWQAFVTFDHYINVAPPAAPSFSALAAPTITYGTGTTTLNGQISDPIGIPPGNVNITLNGVTEPAAIDPSTGNFSAVFDTSKLGVSSSPYTITYSYPGSGDIPSAVDTSKSLTVTPRTLVVTALNESKIYGAADPDFGASFSGLASNDDLSALLSSLSFSTNEPAGNAPVGTYTITPSGISSPNYRVFYNTGTLTVTPRALSIYADDVSKIYGNPDPAWDVSFNGFAPGETLTSLVGSITISTNEPAGNAPVGPYTITVSGLSSPNYTITYHTGRLTITPRPLTVTANNASKAYGDPDPAFTASYSGFAPGESASNLGGTLAFRTNEPAGNAPVGSYTITPWGLGSPNYAITFAPGTLSVTPRALTVTANNASKTYGDPDPAFSASYSGFAPSETAGALSGTLTFTTNEPAGNAPVGSYSITPSGLSSANYSIAFLPGTLSITPRSLVVTANNASKTYGDPDPSFSASYSGFAPGEGSSVLSGTLGFTTNEPAGNAPVGSYSITPGGLTSSNYAISFKPGVLTVTPRALVITANNASKTYGDPDPAFSASFSDFATGDNSSVLGGTLAFATNEPSGNAPVGTYTITPGGLTSSNYAISFMNGALTVTPRALTITANNASKVYGNTDPAFTASYSGFAPGENASVLSGSLAFTTNESAGNAPVGTYAITPSGVSAANYAIAFVPGTLSVTPRALTVTANDASKTYGQADPAFAVTSSGFASGDTLGGLGGTLAFTTTESNPLTAPVGTYTITPSGLTSPNYTITFDPGTLTVNRAVTAFASLPSPTVPVGSSSVSFSAQVQSNSVLPVGQSVTVTILGSSAPLATGSGVIQSNGTFTAVVMNTATLPIGTYTVRYSYAGDHNFTAASATGSLKVAVVYTVKPLYDTTKARHSGSTIPIQLEVDNASGQNVSSANLAVTAVALVDSTGHTLTPQGRGNANPGNAFRYTNQSYLYNLDTTGLAPGKYTLLVSVGNDPVLHAVTFVIG